MGDGGIGGVLLLDYDRCFKLTDLKHPIFSY